MASILLVEDVEIVRTVLRRFLESAGHVVNECEGGDEARRLTAATTFDVVVTDLWMMKGAGVDFIRDAVRNGGTSKIIAMTGGDPNASGSRSVEMARAAGAARVLMKPVTKTDLLAAIDAVLPKVA